MALIARLLAIACLLPLAAEGSFYFSREGRLQLFHTKEVRYRVEDGTPITLQRALAESPTWPTQQEKPYAANDRPKTIWARIDAPGYRGVSRILVTGGEWEQADFYLVTDGKVAGHARSGVLVPWSERTTHVTMNPVITHAGFVSFEVPPGQPFTILARLHSDSRYAPESRIFLRIWDFAAVAEGEKTDRIVQGLFYGVMFFLLFYNLGLFIATKDRSHLYYVVMEGGFTAAWSFMFGLPFEYLWPEHPGWDFRGQAASVLVGGAGMSLFLRQYLDAPRLFPVLDKLFIVSITINLAILAGILLFDVNYSLVMPLLLYSGPAAAAFMLLVMVRALQRRHPLALNLVLAMSFMGAGFVLFSGGQAGWFPLNDVTVHAGQIGSIAQGVILSLGLSIRLQRHRDAHEAEKRALVEEQNRTLEARVAERTAELKQAQDESDKLLANILPRAIIDELRAKGESEPRRHEEVSILFTDFSGFTHAVATIPPKRLVRELDEIFRAFDNIVAAHGLEKIKTIGDAYMAAAGLPLEASDHAARCVRAGLAMARYIDERNRTAALKWGLRVGVHSGAVVAGVVGTNKYAYDVWGDTVNLANRLESSGEPGRVNVSAYTCELVRDLFECEYRGKVTAKGKGDIDMYFVLRERISGMVS